MFLLIQTLPTFWAERIWIWIYFFFWGGGSKVLDFQVPRFPEIWPGRAWAGLGPEIAGAPSEANLLTKLGWGGAEAKRFGEPLPATAGLVWLIGQTG